MVYLDYNASAPMPRPVIDAVTAAAALCGNPSSVHAYGRRARALVEDARAAVADLVGARPAEITFTGGASEANALALRGCGRRRVLVAASEHESVLTAVPSPALIPVASDGRVEPGAVAAAIGKDGSDAVVSVMLANNETGVVQPIGDIAAVAAEAGALLHCDAVQAPGRLAVDRAALGADLLTLSAHKFGGPKGVGALIVRDGLAIEAQMRGGGQEKGRRGGTENLTGIAGFGAAAELAAELAAGRLGSAEEIAQLRDGLEERLRREMPAVVVFGADQPRLSNTSCFASPGIDAETQVMAMDLAGFAVSAGSACSSGKVQTSHVLRAMGVDEAVARCAIRVSLGPETTQEEVDGFATAWLDLARRLRRSAA